MLSLHCFDKSCFAEALCIYYAVPLLRSVVMLRHSLYGNWHKWYTLQTKWKTKGDRLHSTPLSYISIQMGSNCNNGGNDTLMQRRITTRNKQSGVWFAMLKSLLTPMTTPILYHKECWVFSFFPVVVRITGVKVSSYPQFQATPR